VPEAQYECRINGGVWIYFNTLQSGTIHLAEGSDPHFVTENAFCRIPNTSEQL